MADHLDLVAEDHALAEVAALIRSYHDTVADFPMPASRQWSDRGSDPGGPGEVFCHNDLAPWNLVRSATGWAFIDWDLAAPGRRSWDLAWALLSLVPLMPGSQLGLAETRRRIAVFREGYGAAIFPADVLHVAVERAGREAGLIRSRGSLGQQPYARLLAEGHFEVWASAEEHIRHHVPDWQTAIVG